MCERKVKRKCKNVKNKGKGGKIRFLEGRILKVKEVNNYQVRGDPCILMGIIDLYVVGSD